MTACSASLHSWANPVIHIDCEEAKAMQLAYYSGDQAGLPIGPQVSIDGMQSGRHFTISTLVAPPNYRVFLDGVRVIDVHHESPRRMQAPNFAIFGDGGTGTVRLSTPRAYKVT